MILEDHHIVREPASGPLRGTAEQRGYREFMLLVRRGGGGVHHNGIYLFPHIGIPMSGPVKASSKMHPFVVYEPFAPVLISRSVHPASLYCDTAGIVP